MNRSTIQIYLWSCSLIVCFSGCQGGLQNLPNLSTLNSPTRIPPPATGSYAAPQNYGAPGVSGPTSSTNLKPAGATLAQLRTIESGNDGGDVFGSEGRIPADNVAQGTITARPVVAPPITPKRAMTINPKQATQAAAVSFSQASAPPVITASAINSKLSSSQPFESLPDPRSAMQDSHSEVSDGITWKTAQR